MTQTWSNVDVAVADPAHHGEGPVWDDIAQRLLWVDIPAGTIHCLYPDGGLRRRWELRRDVGCVAPRRNGGLICGVREGFAVVDERDGGNVAIAAVLAPDETLRMNDGACDPVGRFWAGSMAYDERPGAGSLYRLGLGGSVDEVLSGVTVSNGMAWSPNGARCYYIDTGTSGVDVFDYDTIDGALTNRRRLIDLPVAQGKPDGMTVDADGCLWIATWTGGQVRRFDPEGRPLGVVDVPATLVTSCAFGGHELNELYITTSRFGMARDQLAREPTAGAVFVADVGVTGLATPACAATLETFAVAQQQSRVAGENHANQPDRRHLLV